MDLGYIFDKLRFRNRSPGGSSTNGEYNKEANGHGEDLIIDWKRIIGVGKFSVVHIGSMIGVLDPVAVKIPRNWEYEKHSSEQAKLIMDEVAIMKEAGYHENLINLLGVHYVNDTFRNSICLITPICINGSLQEYLRSKPVDILVISTTEELEMPEVYNDIVEEGRPFVMVLELVRFSHQIALGMEYLASKGIIHGDLATRNVLLDENKTCKISDFGMSKFLCQEEEGDHRISCGSNDSTENRKIPWRWMAIECLEGEDISFYSDIWAFGVTIWEIFTIGNIPFPNRTWDSKFMYDVKHEGLRLERPQHASEEIYDLMLHCWATGRSLRPTFSIVADEFQNLKNSYSFDHRYLHELMEQDEPSTLQSMIEDFHRERKRTQSRSSRYTSRMESPFYSKMLLDKATDDPTTDLWSGNFNFSRLILWTHARSVGVYHEILDEKQVFVRSLTLSTKKLTRKDALKRMYKFSEVKIFSLCHTDEHPNVVKFIGKFFTNDQPSVGAFINIVTEYYDNDLHSYLRSRPFKIKQDGESNEGFQTLCRFASEIARGMEFIASKHIIHGDLRTGKVLLDANLTCKINYSYASRQTYKRHNYIYSKHSTEYMAWRWMAPESLKRLEFSTKSDVWSYGVVLWEIFSLGAFPYKGQSWSNDFSDALIAGLRLRKPLSASELIYRQMKHCWANIPSARPDFSQMSLFFEIQRQDEIMNNTVNYLELTSFNPRHSFKYYQNFPDFQDTIS